MPTQASNLINAQPGPAVSPQTLAKIAAWAAFLVTVPSVLWRVLMIACFAPIFLWGPLLLVAVVGYWLRRRYTDPAQARVGS